jgi:hypothetical protein
MLGVPRTASDANFSENFVDHILSYAKTCPSTLPDWVEISVNAFEKSQVIHQEINAFSASSIRKNIVIVLDEKVMGQMVALTIRDGEVSVDCCWDRHVVACNVQDATKRFGANIIVEVKNQLIGNFGIAPCAKGDREIHDALFEHLSGVKGQPEECVQFFGIVVVWLRDIGLHVFALV